MRGIKLFLLVAVVSFFVSAAPKSQAQVSVGVGIGVAPVCPYGYYGYAPYRCSPYGYYGPEWFTNGVFLGAGPWYHGGAFYGHVDRHFDPRYGYHGAYPEHGPYVEHPDHFQSFHASHWSDVHGSYHTEAQHEHYVHH